MESAASGDFAAVLEYYESLLTTSANSDSHKAKLFANIAYAEFELQTYRKCISSCDTAINLDKLCLRAYILKGKALMLLDRGEDAMKTWNIAIDIAKASTFQDMLDIGLVIELVRLRNSDIRSTLSSSRILDPSTVLLVDAVNHNNSNTSIDENSGIDHPISSASIHLESVKTDDTNSNISVDEVIKQIHNQLINTQNPQFNPAILATVRGKLSHASGNHLIDDLTAFGYLQVNTGNLVAASDIFTVLLQCRKDLPAAQLGLGSALALRGKFDEAINAFTDAIAIDSSIADAWKRRAQTYIAKGCLQQALGDITKAATLGDDPDIFFQRAYIFYQMKNYRRSLQDFRRAVEGGLNTAQLQNYIGICEGQLGNPKAAIVAHNLAFNLDSTYKEALLNASQMYKELALWREADAGFKQVNVLVKNSPAGSTPFAHGHWYRAQLLYAIGRPKNALTELLSAISISPKPELEYLHLAGVSWHAQGLFKQAVDYYDRVLAIDPNYWSWTHRECAISMSLRLDRELSDWNIENEVDARVKDAMCKKGSLLNFDLTNFRRSPKPTTMNNVSPCDAITSERHGNVIKTLAHISRWAQFNSQGFLPNARQHTMFGISVLQMAKAMRTHLSLIAIGGPGSTVSNSCRSKGCLSASSGNKTGKRSNTHIFSWRDFFDIAVNWRRLVEPNDSIWWIDRLEEKSFEEGFGLQTCIVQGQLSSIKYTTYFNSAFERMKSLIVSDCYYNCTSNHKKLRGSKRDAIQQSKTLDDIYDVINEDFYVKIPYHSKYQHGGNDCKPQIFEGIRLTLLRKEPEGYDFSIRTPGVPSRFDQFDKELDLSFRTVEDVLGKHFIATKFASDTIDLSKQAQMEVLSYALELFYIWVTFSPLSRGNVFCGHMCLYAIVLSCGYQIASTIPDDMQFAWEAYLGSSNMDEFVDKVIKVIQLEPCTFDIDKIYDPSVYLPTYRHMISYLNCTVPPPE